MSTIDAKPFSQSDESSIGAERVPMPREADPLAIMREWDGVWNRPGRVGEGGRREEVRVRARNERCVTLEEVGVRSA